MNAAMKDHNRFRYSYRKLRLFFEVQIQKVILRKGGHEDPFFGKSGISYSNAPLVIYLVYIDESPMMITVNCDRRIWSWRSTPELKEKTRVEILGRTIAKQSVRN